MTAANVTVFHTMNSTYEIDLPNHRYRRTSASPTDPESERLTYNEWLPLKDTPAPVHVVELEPGVMVLHIMHETSTHGIYTSPLKFR